MGPCKNCGPEEGWQPAYAPRSDGLDQTFHQTYRSSGEVAFNVTASSLDFITSRDGNCAGTYTVNGSEPLSACSSSFDTPIIPDLPLGVHQIVYKPNLSDPSTLFRFLGIQGTIPLPSDAINSTVNLTPSENVRFEPPAAWTLLTSTSLAGEGGLALDVSKARGGMLSLTGAANATAELTFNAASIYVYGTTIAGGSRVLVKVDDVDVAVVDMSSAWTSYSALVYMHSGLDTSQPHSLSFTNLDEDGALVLDYVTLTNGKVVEGKEPSTGLRLSAAIGIAVASAILLIALFILFFWLHARQRRRRRQPRLQISNPHIPSSPTSSVTKLVVDEPKSIASSASSIARSFYSYRKSTWSLKPSYARTKDVPAGNRMDLERLTVVKPVAAREVERATRSDFGDMMSPTTPFSDVMAIEDTAVRATRTEARFIKPKIRPPPSSVTTIDARDRALGQTPDAHRPPSVGYRPRRNISIKSAKSVKSFWSSVLAAAPPPMPSLWAAARPESDLFGGGGILTTSVPMTAVSTYPPRQPICGDADDGDIIIDMRSWDIGGPSRRESASTTLTSTA